MQPINQAIIIMVIYTHIDLGENKYQTFGWYRYTPCRTNPKTPLANRAHYPLIYSANTRSGQTFSTGSTLITRQLLIQTTIVMVIYAHKGLGENKYQKFGWYRHTLGITNPKPFSQTGCIGPYFLVQTQCLGQTFSTGSTLIPRQPLNQTTIIMVIYAHTGLGENKYQNFG